MSGASLLRPGFQAFMSAALKKEFDIVLAEALDRFSRDQEDTAGLFKRLTFAGVRIVTLAEGDITFLHIGFKGTMNAVFLQDLAEKTRRGLRGRIENGKSGGGLCFGYRVVHTLSGNTLTTGDRDINSGEAATLELTQPAAIVAAAPDRAAADETEAAVFEAWKKWYVAALQSALRLPGTRTDSGLGRAIDAAVERVQDQARADGHTARTRRADLAAQVGAQCLEHWRADHAERRVMSVHGDGRTVHRAAVVGCGGGI